MLIARRKADYFPGELEAVLERCMQGYAGTTEAVAAFEAAVRTRVGADGAAAVNSGRRAMTLILRHLGVGPETEVVVPAYTLKDLIPLIEALGARAVPADIDPQTLNVSADTIAARVSGRTRALLVLHAFGAPCPMDEINALAEQHGLPVVEDAAHALGALFRGLAVGALGHSGFYSFEWTKPVNTYGGGMVVSRDPDLVAAVRRATQEDREDLAPVAAKVRAIQAEERMFRSGLARLPLEALANPVSAPVLEYVYRKLQRVPPSGVRYAPLQAELGLQKFSTLEDRIGRRERLVATLRAHLREDVRLQRVLPGCRSTWYFAVAVLPCDARRVRRRLLHRGIDAGAGHEVADEVGRLCGVSCPNAEFASSRALQLPLYESLDDEIMRQIAHELNEAVRRELRAPAPAA